MIWGHDYSTDLLVKLGILALFVAGYLIYALVKRRRNNHDEDRKQVFLSVIHRIKSFFQDVSS